MKLNSFIPIFLVIIIAQGACRQEPEITTTSESRAVPTILSEESLSADSTPMADGPLPGIQFSTVLISEVLTGVPGRNNREFIELYNSGVEAVDLNGWSLWYLTRDDQEPSLVYSWQERTDIPGLGHYLLIREGETFDILPDASYDIALFEGKGGLSLRNADGEAADRFGWGDAPEEFFSQSPNIDFIRGDSFERLPSGESGNGTFSGNNAADFMSDPEANPQNTGSLPRPLNDERISITLVFPEAIPPGEDFELAVNVKNQSSKVASEVKVSMPLANHLSVIELPQAAELADGRVI